MKLLNHNLKLIGKNNFPSQKARMKIKIRKKMKVILKMRMFVKIKLEEHVLQSVILNNR